MKDELKIYKVEGRSYLGGVDKAGIVQSFLHLCVGSSEEEVLEEATLTMKFMSYELKATAKPISMIDGYKIELLRESDSVSREMDNVSLYTVSGIIRFRNNRKRHYDAYHIGQTKEEVTEKVHTELKKRAKKEFDLHLHVRKVEELGKYKFKLVPTKRVLKTT